MNFATKMKGESDLIALCEQFDANYKAGIKGTPDRINEAESDDTSFNPDDLFDTVDIPDENAVANGPEFSADDIELSVEEKEDIRNAIADVLDEIQNKDNISGPALEMIVNEVANEAAYLNEAEEGELNGPVEKEGYRKAKAEAIKKFLNELLGATIADDGEVPENVENLNSEEPVEEPTEEPTEEPVSEPTEEPVDEPVEEPTEEDKGALNEGEVPTEEPVAEPTDEPTDEPVTEGVCMECGEDDIVDVDPSEVIRVVDDNEVTPIEDPSSLEEPIIPAEPVTEEPGTELAGGLSDDAPLTVGSLKELFRSVLAEGTTTEKGFAELWKNLAGNPVTLNKPTVKGEQKTKSPTAKTPEATTYTTPKDETGNEVALSKPAVKGEQKTKSPTAKTPEATT
jgi:hypothetical protein